MISRRDIIKSIAGASVAPVPALASAAAADVPAPQPGPKAEDSGVIKLRFPLRGASDADERALDVRIAPAAMWMAKAGKLQSAGWNAQFLPDGRVLAVRLSPRPVNSKGRVIPGDAPYPESVICLQHLRSAVLDALEASDSVTSIRVTSGGDGPGLTHQPGMTGSSGDERLDCVVSSCCL